MDFQVRLFTEKQQVAICHLPFSLFNNKADAFDYALGKTVTITEVQVSISDTAVTPVDIVPTADTVVTDTPAADEIVIVSDVEEEVIVEETNTPPKRRKKKDTKVIDDDVIDDEIDQGLAAALGIL